MFRNCIRKYAANIKYYEGLSKVNNYRENRSYGKVNRLKAIQKFYDITRETHKSNHKLYPYIKDSERFKEKDKIELAILSIGYAEGLLDSLHFLKEIK